MSYDLKLLTINPKELYHVDFESKIQLKNEIEDGFSRYMSIWPFVTNTDGYWYSLVVEQYGCYYDAFPICDADFEKDEKDIDFPYWIYDEDIKYDLKPLIIKSEFRNDFEKIVKGIISTSNTKTVMLLASYQSHDKEIICGVITFSEYLNLLDAGKILFNVCYIIRD